MPKDEGLEKIRALKSSYKKCFESEDGKVVLEDLKKECFVKHTTFTGEAIQTVYNEGIRSNFLYIQEMMDMSNIEVKETETEA